MSVTIDDLPFEVISIKFIDGEVMCFSGRYRRDLQTGHWHYYEREDKTLLHVAKGTIKYILGGTIETLRLDKKINKLWKQGNGGVQDVEKSNYPQLPST